MTDDLLAAAARYLPGASTWMWSLPADLAFVIARGEGSRLWDTSGRAFIDYVAQPVFTSLDRAVACERDLREADGRRAARVGHELIRRGVFVIPGAKMYLSLAHSDADVDLAVAAFDDALGAVG